MPLFFYSLGRDPRPLEVLVHVHLPDVLLQPLHGVDHAVAPRVILVLLHLDANHVVDVSAVVDGVVEVDGDRGGRQEEADQDGKQT